MARVVGVHGIAQELKGSAVLHDEWWPSLKDGVSAAGVDLVEEDLVCAFYGGCNISENGSEAQKSELLPKLAKGELSNKERSDLKRELRALGGVASKPLAKAWSGMPDPEALVAVLETVIRA